MKVAFITGARSEWRLVEPLLDAARACPTTLPLLFVTGSHLSRRHGHTVDQIRAAGWEPTACVEILEHSQTTPAASPCATALEQCRFLEEPTADTAVAHRSVTETGLEAADTPLAITRATGRAISGLAEALSEHTPDWVVVVGDRYESFAAAVAATMLGRPLAHVGGGETDVATNQDCNLRNAISKLAQLHFVSHEQARERVLSLGEEPWRIQVTGLPSLDSIEAHCASRASLEQAGLVPAGMRFLLINYLPVTLRPIKSLDHLGVLLAALSELEDVHKLFVLSNADAGGDKHDAQIRAWADGRHDATAVPALGAGQYLAALKHCVCFVGNSSSGVIESPVFGTPAVIVGARQDGRPRAENVCDVPDPTVELLIDALHTQIAHGRYANVASCYGDGHAAQTICNTLCELRGHPHLMSKRLVAAEIAL